MPKEDLENPLHQTRDQRGSAQGLFDRERRAFENGKEKKAEVFGHMARYNSLQKTVMEGRVAGRRGRGRPRRRWEDDVKGMLNISMQGLERWLKTGGHLERLS